MLNRENEARLGLVKFNYGVVGLSLKLVDMLCHGRTGLCGQNFIL